MEPVKKPLMTIRPEFISGLVMWRALPWALIGTLALTVMGGTVIWLVLALVGLGHFVSSGFSYFLCFVAGAAGIAPLYYEMQKKIYARTVFHFFEQYLEYESYSLFFRHHAGRIRYHDIAKMMTRSDFLQQHFKLKTIYLSVPGMDWQDRGFFGLKLADIPAGRGIGRRIQTLLDHEEAVSPAPKWVAPQPYAPASSKEPASG